MNETKVDNNSSGGWLRAPRSVALLAAALAVSLVLGIAVVVAISLDASDHGALDRPADPLTDDQAATQVLESAKQIVATARLRDAAGGYSFISCEDANDPPYQVVVYMSFVLPQTNSVKYLRDVATAMAAHGWSRAPTMGEHFGHKLTRDGVTSIFYRNVNDSDFGTMRLYGECRNTADHRNDDPAWTDVTDQLGSNG